MFSQTRRPKGFSLLELVVIIAVLGLLLAVTLPRLFNDKEARLAMAARMVRSDIAAVQRMAVHEARAIEVEFDEDGYTVRDADSGAEVTYGGRFPVTGLSDDFGVAIETEGTVTFNSLGEPVPGSLESVSVYVVSDPALSKEIVVEKDTGHVRVE